MARMTEKQTSLIRGARPQNLSRASMKSLLRMRFCELNLKLEETDIEQYCKKLLGELKKAGLSQMRPRFYFGDEWFSPDETVAISIPFYLGHPKLKKIEQTYMGYVEGSTSAECMRLLRHEAGHCFDHAYNLHSKKKWQNLFGDPSTPYQTDFATATDSPENYVAHLPDQYALTHPTEDFAETFAVWLGSRNWQQQYSDRPVVLAKLEYIQELVNQYGSTRPERPTGPVMSHVRQLKSPIAKHYLRKIRQLDETRQAPLRVELKQILQ